MGFLAVAVLALIVFTPLDDQAADYAKENISIEKNAETGLTDFTVGPKEFSLEIEHTYDVNE